jgi:hypothetical protein
MACKMSPLGVCLKSRKLVDDVSTDTSGDGTDTAKREDLVGAIVKCRGHELTICLSYLQLRSVDIQKV